MAVDGRTYGGLTAQQRSQERRERLLDAGRALVAEVGVAPLTVDLVCQRAGLSKRYFYAEFATKDDLLDACADDLYTRIYAGAVEVVRTAPMDERVKRSVRLTLRLLASNPSDARLYMESPGFPRLRARQQRAVSDLTELMAADGLPYTGRPKPHVDRVLATRALVTATTELITGWLQGDIDTDEDTLVATITAVSLGAAANI
ncbi:TetR/AcrR family transcriptional regulator [Mycobacterium sp. NBC_00419]|uniref:TetR/AcrR family transcriptional regulator n=1 Tax=Mycobacterium sp. NBC_00419 TaxID=2975989 RepID=UPI002E1C3960